MPADHVAAFWFEYGDLCISAGLAGFLAALMREAWHWTAPAVPVTTNDAARVAAAKDGDWIAVSNPQQIRMHMSAEPERTQALVRELRRYVWYSQPDVVYVTEDEWELLDAHLERLNDNLGRDVTPAAARMLFRGLPVEIGDRTIPGVIVSIAKTLGVDVEVQRDPRARLWMFRMAGSEHVAAIDDRELERRGAWSTVRSRLQELIAIAEPASGAIAS